MKYHLLHFWDNPGVTFLQFYKQQTRGCFKQTAKWQCDSVIREHWHKKHRAELSLSYDSLLWLKTSGPDVWCWHLHEASIHYGLQFIAWINAPLPSCGKVKTKKNFSSILPAGFALWFHTSPGLLGNRVDSLAVFHSYFSVTQFSLV